ncbi:MAG: metal-sensing transcriptional repressor [Candidatus Gracilibacteria bacterium]|jgi:DNA-binding FrmR family transcriptional regulator
MAHNTDKVMIAMRKSRSVMDKVLKMLEQDQYCIDVIQQNLAIIGLLRSANLSLLEGHINHCVKDAAKQKDAKRLDEMMSELLKVIQIAQSK